MRCATFALLSLAVIAYVSADITFSRTVSDVATGWTGSATVDSGCTGSDDYGSNDCTLHWGEDHKINIAGDFPSALDSKSKVSVALKVDEIFPWNFECNLCGAPCTITIPVVKKTITLKLPPCPIPAGKLNVPTVNVPLPAKSPVPVGISAKGTATVYDDAGNTIAKVDANAGVGPDMDSVHPLPDYETGVKALPEMIVAVINSMGFNVTDVTVEDTPFWSQFMGGKGGGAQPAAGGKQGGAFDYSKFMGGKGGGAQPAASGKQGGANAFDWSKFTNTGAKP